MGMKQKKEREKELKDNSIMSVYKYPGGTELAFLFLRSEIRTSDSETEPLFLSLNGKLTLAYTLL